MVDMLTLQVLEIFALAFMFELVDAALGQGYGTLGSPTFILLGLNAKIVVPAILISQAMGGLMGAYFHHKRGNADFTNHKTLDSKRMIFIVACGIIGVIAASIIGFKISKDIMTTYIGIVVLVMGLLILSGVILKFTWKKLGVIGTISAFNKGLSGGGYGPVVAGGQAVIGVDGKNAIAITDFAEAPICIAGFITWCMLSWSIPPMEIMVPMCIGASIAPIFGSWITMKLSSRKLLKKILGVTIAILGILCLARVLNP